MTIREKKENISLFPHHYTWIADIHPLNPQQHQGYQMLPHPLQVTLYKQPILLVIWSS
jgi:hypothetical protein